MANSPDQKSGPRVATFTVIPTTPAPLITTLSPTPLPFSLAKTTLPSPNGKWVAYFFGYNLSFFRLSAANIDGSIVWNVNQPNVGGDWFSPYRWSKDSRYLYFNIHVDIDGYVPFYDGMGLQRLDVSTGNVSEILSSGYLANNTYHIYNWNIVSFSLSPNDEQLAYIDHVDNEAQLVVRDMKTGKEESLLFKGYSNAGSIVWSPQQDRLALALAKGINWSNTLGSIEVIGIDNLASKVLIKDEKRVLDPIEWENSNIILLKERGGEYFFLDVNTQRLSNAPIPTSLPK